MVVRWDLDFFLSDGHGKGVLAVVLTLKRIARALVLDFGLRHVKWPKHDAGLEHIQGIDEFDVFGKVVFGHAKEALDALVHVRGGIGFAGRAPKN